MDAEEKYSSKEAHELGEQIIGRQADRLGQVCWWKLPDEKSW